MRRITADSAVPVARVLEPHPPHVLLPPCRELVFELLTARARQHDDGDGGHGGGDGDGGGGDGGDDGGDGYGDGDGKDDDDGDDDGGALKEAVTVMVKRIDSPSGHDHGFAQIK
eukprot:3147120-Rhodomonas_salina.2